MFAESRLCDIAGSGTRTDNQKPSDCLVEDMVLNQFTGRAILHAPAVEDTVIHQGQPLDLRLPAGSLAHEEDDRADRIFDQGSICHTICLRFAGSISADRRSISASTSELQPV